MSEVSVVIPLHSKDDTIGRCLASVQAQTITDIEVIVVHLPVEGAPFDDIVKKVADLDDSRIRLVPQQGKGVASARNQGIEAAQANLVAFLDADDEWTPQHLEVLLQMAREHPEAGVYGTASMVCNGAICKMANYGPDIPPDPWEGVVENYWRSAHKRYFPPLSTSNVAVPKRILREMGGFNPGMSKGEDLDLWGRIALKYPVVFSWKGMGIYHTEGTDRLTITDRKPREFPSGIVESGWKALDAGEVSPQLMDDLIAHLEDIQLGLAWINLKAGRPDLARMNLKGKRTRRGWASAKMALFWTFVPASTFNLFYQAIHKMLG